MLGRCQVRRLRGALRMMREADVDGRNFRAIGIFHASHDGDRGRVAALAEVDPREIDHQLGGGPIHGVPKLDLVSRLQALLHEGRLKIHKDLAEAETLVRELQDFRCEFTAAGHLTFNARSGKHDDLVLALAIAVWRAADGGMKGAGWFRYYQELAGAVVPPRDVIGVDLGQSRDPTAIAIVRRVEDPDGPEVPAVEIRLPQQPESTAAPLDLTSPEHRDEVIEATKAALRHRISSGGPFAATFGSR